VRDRVVDAVGQVDVGIAIRRVATDCEELELLPGVMSYVSFA
jgi:hypothetical protein